MSSTTIHTVTLQDGDAIAYFGLALTLPKKEIDAAISKHKETVKEDRFHKGERYFLQTAECEDYETLKREYEIVAVVNQYEDTDLDAVVVKQLSGIHGTSYSLAKTDCKLLGIEYEKDLLLMPQEMNWFPSEPIKKKVEKAKEAERKFTSRNLATYPLDYETKTIQHIACRISGFKVAKIQSPYYGSSKEYMLETPTKHYITFDSFMSSFRVYSKKDFQGTCETIHQGDRVHGRFITNAINHNFKVIDETNDSIYFEIDLTNGNRQQGIIPNEFEGLDLCDAFMFTWQEPGVDTKQWMINYLKEK